MSRRKNILFGFLMLAFALPLLNMKLKLIKSRELDGAATAGYVNFSWKEWWDGNFQKGKDQYLNDHIGFRPDLVRLNNQLNLWLYGKLMPGGVTMDEEGYLYYTEYTEEYTGQSYEGEEHPKETLWKLKKIQDTLERLGKTVVFVYAPSKPYYFPEYLPGNEMREGQNTNFKSYFRIGDSLGVHQIDMNRWYVSLKNKTQYPLFSKQGMHYTLYGVTFAIDSIIRYIESARGIRMPHPVCNKIEISSRARKTDDDVGKLLNLMFPIKEQFYYPELEYKPDTLVSKPKAIYIGDSFIWTMLFSGIMNCNTDPEFWYYSKYFYNTGFEHGAVGSDMDKYDWERALLATDCVILVYTAPQLTKMHEGFIEKAYGYFYGG